MTEDKDKNDDEKAVTFSIHLPFRQKKYLEKVAMEANKDRKYGTPVVYQSSLIRKAIDHAIEQEVI